MILPPLDQESRTLLYDLAWLNVFGAVQDVAALKNAPASEDDCAGIAAKILVSMESADVHAFVHYGDRAIAKCVALEIIAELDIIGAENMIRTLAKGVGIRDLGDAEFTVIRDDVLSSLRGGDGMVDQSICWPSQEELEAIAAMRFGDTTITSAMLGKLVFVAVGHA